MKADRSPGQARAKRGTLAQLGGWLNVLHRGQRRRQPGRDVRQLVIWISVLLTAFLLPGFVYAPGTVLHIAPQTTQLKVGETAAIDLMVQDVQGLYGVEIHVRFDPDAVQVVDANPDMDGVQIEPGTLPIPDFVAQNEVDNGTGTIDYVATQLPPSKPGTGSGTIARVALLAVKPSTSHLEFERFVLADTTGGNIDALRREGQIKVIRRSSWILYTTAGVALACALGGIGYLAIRKRERENAMSSSASFRHKYQETAH